MTDAPDDLPSHIRETAQAIAELHAAHARNATRAERRLESAAAFVATPTFFLMLSAAVVAWIAFNSLLAMAGRAPLDPPPYSFLQGMLALLAVYISLSILTAQRRASALADLRAQVTLEHSILAESKAAKMIELLEELRRDDPLIENRSDRQATAMSSPADPQKVAAAIIDSHANIDKDGNQRKP
jgi:uncharacterized membrane protein